MDTRRDMKTEPAIMAERLNTMMHGDLKQALLRSAPTASIKNRRTKI